MHSKYAPLESHLRDSERPHLPMTFGEIERVIGTRLPPAALKHRAMWSNNPGNWVMTKAWLAAGYETQTVDMEKRKLVFRRVVPHASPPDAGSRGPRAPRVGGSPPTERTGSFARIFGALKDTITVAPGTNLTDPSDEEWDAAR